MADITVTVTNPVTRTVEIERNNINVTAGTSVGSASTDALSSRLVETGSYLESLIQVSNAGVSSLNLKSGVIQITGAGNVTVIDSGQQIIISGAGSVGDYYPNNNPSGFLTGFNSGLFALKSETGHNHDTQYYPLLGNPSGFLTGFNSGLYALKSETGTLVPTGATGNFVTTSMTGHNHDTQYYPRVSNPSGFLTGFNSGLYALKSETGTLVPTGATGNFVTTSQTGHNHDGQYYPLSSNPSSYVTASQTGTLVPTGLTGVFLTTGQTGVLVNAFYPLNSNPSSYVTAAQTGTLVPTGSTGVLAEKTYVNNASGVIRTDLAATGSFLYGLIQASSAGVGSLNGQSGTLTLSGTGNVSVVVQGQTIYVSGNTGAYANFVFKGETGTFVTSDKTGTFVTSSQTGTFVTTGQTGALVNVFYPLASNPSNYVTASQTGTLVPTGATGAFTSLFYPLSANPSNYVTTAQTGTLVPTGATGAFVNLFYPLSSNPSNYITAAQTGSFADQTYVQNASGVLRTDLNATGSYLYGLVQASSAGVSSINSLSGSLTMTGTGNVTVISQGQTVTISGNTGAYANFVFKGETGTFVTNDKTGNFVTTGQTGALVNAFVLKSETGQFVGHNETGVLVNEFYPLNTNPSSYVTSTQTGILVPTGATGAFVNMFYPLVANPSNYVTSSQTGTLVPTGLTGIFVTTGQTGLLTNTFYPLNSNPSNYVTTAQTGTLVPTGATGAFVNLFYPLASNPSNYVTTAQTGILVPTGLTGIFVTTGQTGLLVNAFYPLQSNPSNYVTASQTGTLVPTGLTGIFVTKSETGQFVGHNETGVLVNEFYPLNTNPLNYVTAAQTGTLVPTGATGLLVNVFYPLNSNPSSYVTAAQTGTLVPTGLTGIFVTVNQTGNFATQNYVKAASGVLRTDLNTTGAYLESLIAGGGVTSLNGVVGIVSLTGAGSVVVTVVGQTFTISGSASGTSSSLSGQMFQKNLYVERPTDNEDISWFNKETINLQSIVSVSRGTGIQIGWTLSQSPDRSSNGTLIVSGYTDSLTTGNSVLNFFNPVLSGDHFLLFKTQTTGGTIGDLSLNLIGEAIVLGASAADYLFRSETGIFVVTGQTGELVNVFYPLGSNPSNYVTASQTGTLVPTGLTGIFVTTSMTGNLAPKLNAVSNAFNLPVVLNNAPNFSGTTALGWDDINQSLEIGLSGGLPTNPLSIIQSGNTYYQVNVQNRSTGTLASADYVATANNGTDVANYIDLGINSNNYADTGYALYRALDGYLYVNGGNLNIGTSTTGYITFHVSGVQATDRSLDITRSGINLASGRGVFDVSGNPYAQVRITGSSPQAVANWTGIGGAQVFLSGGFAVISGGAGGPGSSTSYFSKNAAMANPDGIPSGLYLVPVFRANVACTLTGIHINRVGGSGVSILAYRNTPGTNHSILLASAATGSWSSTSSLSNTAYVVGDSLYVMFSGLSNLPTAVNCQFDFSSP